MILCWLFMSSTLFFIHKKSFGTPNSLKSLKTGQILATWDCDYLVCEVLCLGSLQKPPIIATEDNRELSGIQALEYLKHAHTYLVSVLNFWNTFPPVGMCRWRCTDSQVNGQEVMGSDFEEVDPTMSIVTAIHTERLWPFCSKMVKSFGCRNKWSLP